MAPVSPDSLSDRVTCLGSAGQALTGNIVASTNEIVRVPGVEQVVLLPDTHLKEKYIHAAYKATVPSSAVIVSQPDVLIPQFRSRGIGCGMMLVGTGVVVDDQPGECARFLRHLSRFLGSRGPTAWSRHLRPRQPFDMSPEEMLEMGTRGAPWVGRRFGLSPGTLRGFYRGGSYLSEEEIDRFSWDDFSPQWIEGRRRNGRQLGLDLGGNHFLEAQVAQDVPETAESPWLKRGELVLLYHGSCNGLASVLRPDLVERLIERQDYISFTSQDPEYALVLRAVKVLLNWSAAARCIVLSRLRSLLAEYFPKLPVDGIRCVSEAPHNTIQTESVHGAQKLVYRHNAVPMEPGRPVIVSGRHDHPSYLFSPGHAPEASLNTMDHGVGALLEREASDSVPRTQPASQRTRRWYLRGRPLWDSRQRFLLIDPSSTEPLFRQHYQRMNVISDECCRLRPLATLKRKSVPLRGLLPFQRLSAR